MPHTPRVLDPARRVGVRPALLFGALVAVLSALYFVPGIDQLASDLAYSLVAILAGLAVLAGIRLNRPERRGPWLLLAAGTLLFATGDVLWMVLNAMGETPFPSVADAAYILGYPVLMLAFLYVIAVRVGRGDRSGLLDAAILATAVALGGWVVIVRPVLLAPGDPLALAVGAAYPLGDLVIIAVAIGMLATPGPRGASFALLVAGLALQFTGDVVYALQVALGTATDGSVLDLTWLAAYAVTGVAALVPSMRVVAVPHPVRIAWLSPVRLLLLALAMLAGPVLVTLNEAGDQGIPLLAAGSAILSLMVLARLAVVVRALARDNAARRSLEEELGFRASHDPLTGLANRRGFSAHLEAMLASRSAEPHTILFLDLDDFKSINDTLGHAAGDALLVAVAGRIRSHLRDGDHAARMGGDEFAVLLRVDEERAIAIAKRLLDSLREPVTVAGASIVARGSIGVARVHLPRATVADVLADADIAMYEAKARGKGQVCAYAQGMRARAVDRMHLEADLRRVIERHGLGLEYQPIVDLHTGRVLAVEALVRWTHPVRGPVPPDVFVPLAEATGLIRPLGEWILDTACHQVAAWRHALEPSLGLSLNLSPRQVADPDLAATVQAAAGAAGLPVSALILEVTEGALLVDDVGSHRGLDALRALGAWVAIDDFGTGYSSLGALGRLPVDILKIDRTFVDRVDRDDDRRLAAIVMSLGETLGLRTVAEGIDRPEQLLAMRQLGCGLGQGNLLAPPLAPAAFEALYATPAASARDGLPGRLAFPSASGA